MAILVISDIHANLVALEAVLADAGPVEAIWCLGDIVGYGPRPNECCALVREQADIAVVGNHDWAAFGQLDTSDFNDDARAAAEWTRAQLDPAARSWLEALPNRHMTGDAMITHGSPRMPVWEYLRRVDDARANFGHFDTGLCLVGHTHIPTVFEQDRDGAVRRLALPPAGTPLRLDRARFILNPGSVGQPRDGDHRAAYGLYDPDARTFTFRRCEYDLLATQRQMVACNLPPALIVRLIVGL